MQDFLTKIKFEKWKAWIYLLPAIFLLLVFTVWPIFNTVRLAFLEDYDVMQNITMEFMGEKWDVGFGNFEKVIFQQKFWKSVLNTVLLTVITVPISTFLALLIAVCLNSIKALQKIIQTIFFLPYVTNSIAIGMVFAAMFSVIGIAPGGTFTPETSAGIINQFLGLFGVAPIDWIGEYSPVWANFFVMSVYIVWNALPFKILVLLGGLQSVNKQYYEAAKVDATPRWRVFTKITVPLLSPMIAYLVITSFIGGFKEYSSIIGVFGDNGEMGPNDSLITIVGYLYRFIANNQGVASAAALVLFALIFGVTMINLKVSNKKTHY
jgi:multiple sugar transport system permease protein